MKILFHGRSKGFAYLSAILMLVGICFVLLGINTLVTARYSLVKRQSEQFYMSVQENNEKVLEEK